ncbi:MAG TPA: cytochrome c [Vicinamibacterales bacterium]
MRTIRAARLQTLVFALLAGGLAPDLASAEVSAQPTFSKDVAPIFQAKCEACHRPGSIAPMSLRTFDEARPWARSIKARVLGRQMPPWHLDKTVGIQEFKNDPSLSDDQITTIVKWVDAGAPQGDPRDLPPLKTWAEGQGWNYAAQFGQEPDLIVRSEPWTQRAGANDTWWKPIVETGIREPRWVRAIEVRPGTVKGRKITHHANSDLLQNEPGELTQAGPGRFMEWAVGKDGEIMRPNSGKLMLPGSRIAWDIHYSAADEDVTDVVEMGIYFYPKGQEPKYRQHLLRMGNTGTGAIDIPPNTVKASESFVPLRQAARVESFQPHMHLRGKAMSLEAILPSGRTVILSHVDNFTFNWHTSYVYADDAAPLLPKGTVMKITAWHDNTSANPSNPDPNVWVGYGDRTVDEMGHAWVNVTYLTDEEYLAEVEARRTRLAKGTQ